MTTLHPECGQPFFEYKMCEDCGVLYDEPKYLVYDLYNYNARPQRSYHRLDHFKEVLEQFHRREGKPTPATILRQIRHELPTCSEATAIDVKKAMRKLSSPSAWRIVIILFAATGKQPRYIKHEIEVKIVGMFKMIDRVYHKWKRTKAEVS